jgi:hypothetical protein
MPPCRGGLRYATCLTAPDPTSLQGRAPMRHVSYNSGSCLPIGKVFGAPRVLQLQILFPCRGGGGLWSIVCAVALDPLGVLCVLWLRIPPSCREGSGAATSCLTVSCGPWASSIKKSVAGLPVQLASHMFPMHARMSPKRLTSGLSWACKTCVRAPHSMPVKCADMWLQCNAVLLTTRLTPLQCWVT